MRHPAACLALTFLLVACDRKPAPPAATAETPEQALVREVSAAQMNLAPASLKMSMTFSDLNMGSLDLVEVIMELEDRTKTKIPDDDLARRSHTSGTVVQLLKSLTLQNLADALAQAKKHPLTQPSTNAAPPSTPRYVSPSSQ